MWNNLGNTFQTILVISAIGVLLTGMLLAIKYIFRRRFSAGWFYYIWLLVLIAMLVPVRVNWNKIQRNTTFSQVVDLVEGVLPIKEIQKVGGVLHTQPEVEYDEQGRRLISTDLLEKRIREIEFEQNLNWLSVCWLLIASLLLLGRLVAYAYYLTKIRRTTNECEIPQIAEYTSRKVIVRKGAGLPSPMLLGVFRPMLLLPERELTEEQLHNVLAHEMTHLKRNDMLVKWFMVLVKSVHWFNPLVYWLEKQVEQECEISCDIAVTSGMNAAQKKSYADTILLFLMGRRKREFSLSMGMAGTKGLLKKRFLRMKQATVISRRMKVCSGVMTFVLLTVGVVASGNLMNRTFPYTGTYTSSEHFCNSCQLPYHFEGSRMEERYLNTDRAGWYWNYSYECPKCGNGYSTVHFVRAFNQDELTVYEDLQAKQYQEQQDRWMQIRSEIRSK